MPPIVSNSITLDKGRRTVELDDGRRVRLDPEDKRTDGYMRVLEGLSELRLPVYLDVDASDTIREIRIPLVVRVVGIEPADEGLDVRLEPSHAGHFVRPGGDSQALEARLREALESRDTIIVTENDAHEIIDVRDFRPGPEGPQLPFPRPEPEPRESWLVRIWRWCWWPWRWFRCCISARRAQQVFDAMNATTCDPLTVPPPCIPFLYPDDGCWGRAHEMRRLMVNMGLKPKKVWIQASHDLSLKPSTRNNPSCSVGWSWHVAPTLCVRGRWFFNTQQMVIDPSLFTTPVTKAQWKAIQNDPNATLTDSDGSIFYLWGNVTDPSYTQTNTVLATYRLQLQLRAIQVGPPPYANCP
jgi:hypothetical protein